MPTFEEALDDALLAFGRGAGLARAESERVAREFPSRPEGPALLALWHLGSGDPDAARRVPMADDAASRAVRSAMLIHEGERERAEEEIEAALALSADHPLVLRLASGLLGIDDPERGLALARRAVELRPHDSLSHFALYPPLNALGRQPELEALVESPPPGLAGSPVHALMGSMLATRQGDAERAERWAREAVALGPDLIAPWTRLASILVSDGRTDGAEEAVRHALAINPRASAALSVLARVMDARGNAKEAARLREEARRTSPVADALRAVDDVRRLFFAGRHDEVLAALDRLDDLPPVVRRSAFPYRIRMLSLLGEDEGLQRALAAYGADDAFSAVGEAELLLRAKRFTEARERLEARWREERPPVIAAFLMRAYAGCDEARARSLAEELIETPPGNALDAYLALLAVARARLPGNATMRYLHVAERRYPSSSPIREFRTGVLMRAGRFHEAWQLGESLEGPSRKRFQDAFVSSLGRAIVRTIWGRLTGRKGKPPRR